MSYADLADAMGDDAARALCRKLGGRRLYIPLHSYPMQPAMAALDITAQHIAALQAAFGGEYIDIPRMHFSSVAEKHRAIRQRRTLELATISELAREFDLTMRQIYNIVGADDARTPDLFTET